MPLVALCDTSYSFGRNRSLLSHLVASSFLSTGSTRGRTQSVVTEAFWCKRYLLKSYIAGMQLMWNCRTDDFVFDCQWRSVPLDFYLFISVGVLDMLRRFLQSARNAKDAQTEGNVHC